jgi:transcription termination/antitermination protein NusA
MTSEADAMLEDLVKTLDEVEREKGIDRDILIEALEAAMLTAARKKKGLVADLEAQFDEETGEINVIEFKTVVEEVANPELEISLGDALEIEDDPDLQVGDQIGLLVPTADLGRIAAQTAKQVIIQRVREADRSNIFDSFKDRKGELMSGTVRRIERGNVIVDLLKAEAVLPYREQVPREAFRVGDRIEALVLDIRREARGHQIVLSRAHPDFVVKLFEREVPEIYESIVSINAVAREAGTRTKIAVDSRDGDVDPVGACVGMKGIRVQAVVQELRGEKIDIVPWSSDTVRFVCSALQPAEVTRVLVDEADQRMEIVVPDEQLSLAIGRRGQNVRLAAELTGWKLELSSESKMNEKRAVAFESLSRIEGVGDILLQTLYNYGYTTAKGVTEADPAELATIPGVEAERAIQLVEAAAVAVASEHAEAQIRTELSRDQAARDRLILSAVDAAGDESIKLAQIAELGAPDLERLSEGGIDDIVDLYFDGVRLGLEEFAVSFELSESRAWVVVHRAELALKGLVGDGFEMVVDPPSEENFTAALAEVADAAASADADAGAEPDTAGDDEGELAEVVAGAVEEAAAEEVTN